jgi:transcriptional regulator with XRE-family HTH domain
MRAARALLRWSASDLARQSGVSLSTIQRAEAVDGQTTMTFPNASAIRRTFENAGVQIIEEDRAGPGARLTQPLSQSSKQEETGAAAVEARTARQTSKRTAAAKAGRGKSAKLEER